MTAILGLTLTLVVLLLQALHPAWNFHLATDINVYFARAAYLWEHGNLTELANNEYQPGALLFFFISSLSFLLQKSLTTYLWTIFFINVGLITGLAAIFQKARGWINVLLFTLILLFTGPIVLYRFDLYVVLLILSSLIFAQKRHYTLSVTFLALATLTKVFPAVLLPFILLSAYKNQGLGKSIKTLVSFLLGYLLLLVTFLQLFQAPFSFFTSSFGFLSQIPIHTESVWGTLITLWTKVSTGEFARGAGAWGIFGVAREFSGGLETWANYVWVLPMGIFYAWVWKHNQSTHDDIRVPIAVILLFLITSKIIHLQYTLWFMLLVPLLDHKHLMQTNWIINIFLILTATIFHHFVYPLQYTEFTSGFYGSGSHIHLFWLITVRNMILLTLFARIVSEISRETVKSKRSKHV